MSPTTHAEFVHLHNHTEYSLLDGASRITDDRGNPGELIKLAAQYRMPALAMTDHGNLYGAIEFYQAATAAGIKPIIGCEVYVAPRSRLDKQASNAAEATYHLTLIAKDEAGYRNLMKLSSLAFLEGYYYKPRVDRELLAKYHEGLIALSGCLKSELSQALLAGQTTAGETMVDQYLALFGRDHFYLELMKHGLPEQDRLLPPLLDISQRMGVPVVATNDCHYLRKEDAPIHDVRVCISTGTTLDDPRRLRLASDEFYLKSPQEMARLFDFCPPALKSTLQITEQCTLVIPFDQLLLPHYEPPAGQTPDSWLEQLCQEGLRRRYGGEADRYAERLRYELSVIQRMGFSTYFLIVSDFIQFARREGIPVGPGRGSGAGSLVAYVLGITNVCPMKYGLLFERFLNPERKTMPDLDIDFSDEGRERVIRYVREKYGETNVAQIITFGSLQARLVVRDVGRVLGVPLPEVDRLAKLIPREPGASIASARRSVPELEQIYQNDPQVHKLLDMAQRLEGLKRHTGVHAAGIVIAKDDLTHYTPLGRGAKGVITTQFNDEALLKLGLLKIDFLGLRTLTVIHETVQLVKARHDPSFDLAQVSLEDPKTFRLLQEARTVGIFQLESQGMRDLLRKIKPTQFEDIVALIALYRPGPMGAGMLDEFVRRKHHPDQIKYDHPLLEPILRDSYGICLFQEQVMKIAQEVAGFSPGQADILRKAMGKKIPEELERQREDFLKGAKQRGIDRRTTVKIFEQIVHFGGYGFNKSHSVVYGLVSYHTAYLKANHPIEYMTSLITSEIGRSAVAREEESKLVHFLTEAETMGIAILPPDVQTSAAAFAIQEEGIRFGLLAVKHVGGAAAEAIVHARQQGGRFLSLGDVCRRLDLRQVNRKVLESLIKAGALDRLGQETDDAERPERLRAQLYHRLVAVLGQTSRRREEVLAGQGSLFECSDMPSKAPQSVFSGPPAARAPSSAQEKAGPVTAERQAGGSEQDEEWPEHLLLSYEKEVLGFYLSGHPLAKYQREMALYSTHHLGQLGGGGNGQGTSVQVRIAGMIANVKRLISKSRKAQYARCRFEDLTGEIDLVVFPKSYAEGMAKHLRPGEMVVVTGRVSRRSEEHPVELIAEEILSMRDARERFIRRLVLKFSTAGLEDGVLVKVKELLKTHAGGCQVWLQLATPRHGDVVVETELRVKPTEGLLQSLEQLLGNDAWSVGR